MKNDINELLNDLLIEWHRWARGYQLGASHGSCAMFESYRSSRQWEEPDVLHEQDVGRSSVKAVEFAINGDDKGQGAMQPVYRTALQMQARNLSTGRSVWSSPRLPSDAESRAQVLGLARAELLTRLSAAGVV